MNYLHCYAEQNQNSHEIELEKKTENNKHSQNGRSETYKLSEVTYRIRQTDEAWFSGFTTFSQQMYRVYLVQPYSQNGMDSSVFVAHVVLSDSAKESVGLKLQ